MINRIVLLATAISLALPLAAPVPVKADPPSWAPAHGYRAKQHKDHKHNYSRNHYDNELFVSDGSFLRCNRDVAGAIIGGGTGAVLGSTIGKGSGRDAAMIGGAILGMLSGYSIGQNLDQGDLACTGYALQRVTDGQSVRWQNPDSGAAMTLYRPTAGKMPKVAIAANIVQPPILAGNCRKPLARHVVNQTDPGRLCLEKTLHNTKLRFGHIVLFKPGNAGLFYAFFHHE